MRLYAFLTALLSIMPNLIYNDANSILHLTLSAALCGLIFIATDSIVAATSGTLLIGFVKEVGDPIFSHSDIFFNCVGLCIALTVITIYLANPKKGII